MTTTYDSPDVYSVLKDKPFPTLMVALLYAANLGIDRVHDSLRNSYLALGVDERAQARRNLRLGIQRLENLLELMEAAEQTYTV